MRSNPQKTGTVAVRKPRSRIVTRSGVCGGNACIRGTRVPVWGLAAARQRGIADAAILEMYPELSQADLKSAWRYVMRHAEEINRLIRENRDA
jgi:uncharacterized protein (DUF433 family)